MTQPGTDMQAMDRNAYTKAMFGPDKAFGTLPAEDKKRVADKMVEDEINAAGLLVPGCEAALTKAAADASLEAKERDENFDRDDYSKRLFGLPFKQLSAEHKERVVNQMMLDERRAGGHQISEETAQAKAIADAEFKERFKHAGPPSGHFMVGGHDLRGPATPGGGTTEAKGGSEEEKNKQATPHAGHLFVAGHDLRPPGSGGTGVKPDELGEKEMDAAF